MAHLVDSFIQLLQQLPPYVALLLMGVGMMLESMCLPVPSEVVLTLAGWWVAQGKFGATTTGFLVALIVVTSGCLIGSSIAYSIGFFGGKRLVERFGRYILVTPHRLEIGERWIERFGPAAIVLGRLMFAVRAVISYPVGILRMPYHRFLPSTLVGCLIWNFIAMYLGFLYGEDVRKKLHDMSIGMFAVAAVLVFAAGGIYFRKTHFGAAKDESAAQQPDQDSLNAPVGTASTTEPAR